VRLKLGRNAKTTFLIVDAQSVKNTDTAEQKGYDAGKKDSGAPPTAWEFDPVFPSGCL
jgi:hypothetical protein